MLPLKVAVPLILAAGLAAASPAAAASHVKADHRPVAQASGGDAGPPSYPGLVNTRMVRTQKALDRALDYADDGQPNKAASALAVARVQLRLAWRASKYVIQNAPPPPAGDLRAIRPSARDRVRARRSGAAPAAGTVADQYQTAGAVLELQHTVAQTALGSIDMAHNGFRDSLSRTLFVTLDQRDAAIAYIHSIDIPPPPGDGVRVRTSGAPVGGSWATILPTVGGQVDDEINQIEGALDLAPTMAPGIARVYRSAEFQVIKTQRNIDQWWPPVVGD